MSITSKRIQFNEAVALHTHSQEMTDTSRHTRRVQTCNFKWPKSKWWAYVNASSLHRPAAKIVIKRKEMWYKRKWKAGCQLHPPPLTSLPTHTYWTDRPFLSRLTAFHRPWREHSGPHICLPGPRQSWLLHPDPADHTNHPQLMWTIRRSLAVSITAHLFSEASPPALW